MTVLLNHENILSSSSSVLQYVNEPFYVWSNLILHLLYKEIEEDYILEFYGREEEISALSLIRNEEPHCVEIIGKKFQIDISLQDRIIALNRLIKERKFPVLDVLQFNAEFIGQREVVDRWKNEIGQLEVRNSFCKVLFEKKDISEYCGHDDALHSIIFFIVDGNDDISKIVSKVNEKSYAFILDEGKKNTYREIQQNCYILGIDKEHFYDAVFKCLFLFPLVDCFYEYTSILINECNNDYECKQIKALRASKPIVEIEADNRIEVGHSIPLRIKVYPENARIPKLIFRYQHPGIVTCDRTCIYGEQEGKTSVRVFESGSIDSIAVLNFEVYKRNRISTLVMSEKQIVARVGEKVQLSCDYYPTDADNTETIQWYSDNSQIASVDGCGAVSILSYGLCKIYCTAENISCCCEIRCKYGLQEIKLDDEAMTSGILLHVGEKREVTYRLIPEDAYDNEIVYSCNNLLVANFQHRYIEAVSPGKAVMVLSNVTGTVKKTIPVVVKKRGLFG